MLRAIRQLRAICRMLNPEARSLATSLVLRMDNFFRDIRTPFLELKRGTICLSYPASQLHSGTSRTLISVPGKNCPASSRNRCPAGSGTGVRYHPGIGVRVVPEYAVYHAVILRCRSIELHCEAPFSCFSCSAMWVHHCDLILVRDPPLFHRAGQSLAPGKHLSSA